MIRYIYLAGCLLISFTLKAQTPVPDFTASVLSGCAPLTVSFTDNTTNNPKYWTWDFGLGLLSQMKNPTVTFSTPGTYSVSLVVRNADGTNGITKTNYITVSPSPGANFKASLNTACIPADIQFTDLSTPTGAITSYKWDFSDGSSSTLQNPSKTYTTQGYHGVTLTVTTANGCSSTAGGARFIRTINGIKADFDFSRQGACTLPINVDYINHTAGPGALTYAWDFGDGNTSGVKAPSNSYAATGTYNVKLKVTSDFGCENTITKPVTFGNTNTQITAPASSCPNKAITFMNSSTPAPLSSSWDFGDSKSTQTNPSKTYTVPGTYNVTLVSKYAECEGTTTKTIIITNQPPVDFTSPNATGCKVPYTVNFQNTSPDAVSYLWNFGDGNTSTAQNPSHTYNRTGNFDVTLSIVTSGGCPATVTKTAFASVNTNLSIAINGVPKEGCVPLSFSPTATLNSPLAIASYLWTFGNGSTSTLAAPTTSYITGGTYDVKVKITTVGGCVDSVTSVGGVRVGALPNADFSFTPTIDGCASVPVTFTDLSTNADKWLWDFGDGQTSEAQHPVHVFADTGSTISVSLTAFNNGCISSPQTKLMPRRIAPVAKFEAKVNCATPAASRLTVDFVNNSLVDPLEAATTTYLWDFGSGGTTSPLPTPPPFTYPAAGKYTISLTVTGSTCSYTLTKDIDLRIQTADFKINDIDICPYQPFKIETVNVNPNEIKSYTWQLGGSSFIGKSTIDTSFAIKGNYPVTLTMVDTFGCASTKTVPSFINIVGADADFSIVNGGGCANADITFTDLSTAPLTKKWTFDYGNGQVKSYTAPPFTQKYTNSGDFAVFLYIEDSYGCKDTIPNFKTVHITKNTANFGAENTLYCPGAPLQFSDSSVGSNLIYTWTFGDNTPADNTPNPTHAFPSGDGNYSVKLHITDAVGCADSLTRSNYIKILAPKPRFDAQDTVSLCPPLQTFFNSTSKDYDSLYWSFGDGNTSTLDTSSNFYNNFGTYVVKLYTVGYGGCLDSASATVRLLNASIDAKVVFSNTGFCDSIDVVFDLTIPANLDFDLYFNDGQADSSNSINVFHRYRSPGTYQPYAVLKDALGCSAATYAQTVVKVNGVFPYFDMDQKAFCDNGDVFFTNFIGGESNDPVLGYQWEFGDNTTSDDVNTMHHYSQPGTYVVIHKAFTQAGCTSTFPDTVRVYRTPDVTITGNNAVCVNNTLILKAGTVVPDTAISWKWTLPGNTSTDSVLAIKPTTAGTIDIKLEGSTKIGCPNSETTQITVNPLPVITMIPSITTPVGSTVTIPVTYNDPALTYAWTPATYLDCIDCAVPKAVEPKFSTTYRVKVTDNNNCVSRDTIQLNTICNNINYFVPNTFSPNGDGSNDWFYPRGTFINNIQSLRIFNRWGEMVFEKRNFAANNMTDGWNGLYKGKPAAADVYVYIMELICENAQIVPIKGDVTLIR